MGSRPPPRKCEVCREAQSKYKCPNCLVPYCSLACFKKHKENPCEKPLASVEEPCKISVTSEEFTYDPLHAISQLAANSSEIREALQNGDLRRIIQKIDGSDDPADVNQLTKAMEEQIFHDFTEKILSIVSPQE
ncbi:hypothetical protein B296_00006506 [Ensete ventricosum]|uniref:Zinc finger HIT domain-containing protein 3 n=1 Tax=Ensete ventricosum TaxID=4639 RepID=A0A427AAS9_ENSVE|nr:hypothetical protein B296_00006506 [Ensete ventricosum]